VLCDAFDRLDRRRDVWDVLLDGITIDERHPGGRRAGVRADLICSPRR
jgi:hypothetical protein